MHSDRVRTHSDMEALKQRIFTLPVLADLVKKIESNSHIHLSSVAGSFRAFVASYIYEKLNRSVLYLANDADSAEQLREDLEQIAGRSQVVFLTGSEFTPYDPQEPNPSLLSLRMEAMQKFIEHDAWLAVSTVEGITEKFPQPETFLDNEYYLKIGNELNYDAFISHLSAIGFKRRDMVDQVGEFSARGGIIDFFPWNYDDPIRIELFGNTIESIRIFDVYNQRSIEIIKEATILPNLTGRTNSAFITDILPSDAILFCEDTQVIRQKIEGLNELAAENFRANLTMGVEDLSPEQKYLSAKQFDDMLTAYGFIETDLVTGGSVITFDVQVEPHPDFNGSMKLFLEYLRKKARNKNKDQIIIQCTSKSQAERLQEIIDEEEININAAFPLGTLHNGFKLPSLNLEILTDHEIFKRFKRRRAYKRFKSGAYLRQLSSLNLNDYVVHIDYGIGQYLGMETVSYGSVKKECIKIAYQDGDHLFVTVDRLNRVQKYSTEEGGRPKLTRLGTAEWERTKKKTKDSVKKIAAELIRIYAARKAHGGYQFGGDNHWQKELEASFLFEETEDQIKSINEVKQDMESEQPMDRLLCGDVGFGKTEVALRAAFKAVMNNKQSAILVPTTILAFQHFHTFRERLKEFPVRVEMLNRFRSQKQQREILTDLAAGKIDIIVGTHRLLSDDVRFKNLGLLIVDEEQRFGVRQKEKLKKYRVSVDILSMTATPIPRTMHMALMGARDLSHIDTPPTNRLPVHTEIIHWNDEKLHNIIMKEIRRGGQVYFVHNRVETIMGIKEALSEIAPDARIAIGHGQLPERKLEQVMLDFMAKKYDVLLATMIIENGLDIPNVNTIIINRADKFGLSQIYQLRGRVGRSAQQAFAYLLVPPLDVVTEIARKRLRAIQDFTELGSGYKVALRDLEIRGAGNLLGKEQSGFVQSVGFEMYCKILDEAVNELKEDVSDDETYEAMLTQKENYTDPKIDVDFDLLIPQEYIANELERITIYHRLVNLSELEQIDQIRLELIDRFGAMPEKVEQFLKTAEIKVLASRLYARRLILKDNTLKIIFSEEAQSSDAFFKSYIPRLMNQKTTNVKFSDQENLGVRISLSGDNSIEKLHFAKKILENIVINN